jgi:hypothetical protein
MLTLTEIAAIYRQGISTVRRRCTAGSFKPKPFEVHPYRWRRVDIEADLLRRHRRGRAGAAELAAAADDK